MIWIFTALLVIPAGATDFTMINRSINLSNNLNYVVGVQASEIAMSAAQVTFNYDPTALQVNWVRQGDFLYYTNADTKIWHVFRGEGNLTVVSMVMFDFSRLQMNRSTLMTINMKPLRKGVTVVNLSNGIIVNDVFENVAGRTGKNYTIKVT